MSQSMFSAKTMVVAGAMLASLGVASTAMADGKAMSKRQVLEAHTDVLAHIEMADGVEITFSAEYETADRTGEPVLSITAVGPADAYPYVAQLGSLGATSLEAFLAVAPEGTDVPEVILAAHEREAEFLSRSTELYELDLDQAFAANDYLSASCDSYAAFQNSVNSWVGAITSRSRGYHLLSRPAGGNILASVCNYRNGPPVVDLKDLQFCSVTVQGFLICESTITIADGFRVDKAWLGAASTKAVRAFPLPAPGFPNTTSFIAIGGFVP